MPSLCTPYKQNKTLANFYSGLFFECMISKFLEIFYFRNQFLSIWYTFCIQTSSLKCKKWLRKIDQSCWIIQIHTETGVFLYFESMISFSLSNENHAFKKRENLLLRFCTPLMGMIGQFFLANKPLYGYIFEYFFIILSKNIWVNFFPKITSLCAYFNPHLRVPYLRVPSPT